MVVSTMNQSGDTASSLVHRACACACGAFGRKDARADVPRAQLYRGDFVLARVFGS